MVVRVLRGGKKEKELKMTLNKRDLCWWADDLPRVGP